MKKEIICLALASAFASAPAFAETFRLAFSKAEQIEIFIDHPAGSEWCSPELAMRAVYGAQPDQEALARLMPKLGALLDKQCPQAADIVWQAQDASGKTLAHGTSAKAGNWMLAQAPEPGASLDTVAETPKAGGATQHAATSTSEATQSPAEPAPTLAAATSTPTPSDNTAEQIAAQNTQAAQKAAAEKAAADALAAEKSAAEKLAAEAAAIKLAEAERLAAELAATEKLAAEKLAAENLAAETAAKVAEAQKLAAEQAAAAQKAAADRVLAEQVASQRAALGPADFTVGGWKPEAEDVVLKSAPFITEMTDQNDCKVRAGFNLGGDAQYLSLKTKGLSCNAAGYAEGNGSLTVERSDGAVIASVRSAHLSNGYAFADPVQTVTPVATDGKSVLWFDLGHDNATKTYYLLRANVSTRDRLALIRTNPEVDALTEQESSFLQAGEINPLVNKGLDALESVALPNARQARVSFANDLTGVLQRHRDHMMYELVAERKWDYRQRKPIGPWQFQLNRGRNYVFARQERKEQEARELARREEQRRLQALREQANKEKRNLSLYEELVAQAERNPAALLTRLTRNTARYEPLTGGSYSNFYGGGAMNFGQVVRVNGTDGNEAKADFPYDLRIAGGKDMKKKWYLIQGKAIADEGRKDDDGLPMTVVTPDPTGIIACEEDGCKNLADPLVVARMILAEPEWHPDAARSIIDKAQNP